MKKLLTVVLLIAMLVPTIMLVGCSVKTAEDEKNEREAASKYRITVTSSGSACGTVAGGGVYSKGDIIKIEAFPTENYSFSEWGDGNTDNPRMITVTDNKIYKAYFNYTGDCQVTVNVLSIYQGEIKKDEVYGHVEGVGSYKNGTTVTLKAVPEEGCFFVKWDDGCLDAEREVNLTVKDTSFRATFVKADTLYVHKETGYYAAIVGESEMFVASDYVRFAPKTPKNYIGRYEGDKELPLTFDVLPITIKYTAFTKNYFYTMVNSQVGIVTVHAPESHSIKDVKSKEGNKTVDWTYLTDLEEYVKDEGYMMIYFTDFKRTEPSKISEELDLTMYHYHIDCNKYIYYAMYIVYETSKGLCVDRTGFGSLLNTQTKYNSYYYQGRDLVKIAIKGVKN